MTRAVLALCDASSPAQSRSAGALAVQLAAEGRLAPHLAFAGAETWEDLGWQAAWRLDVTDGWAAARALVDLLQETPCAAVVAADTSLCREALGRMAGKLGLPLAGRVLSARLADDALEVVRAVDAGRRSAKFRLGTLPALLLVDPESSFAATAASHGPVVAKTITARSPSTIRLTGERSLQPSEIAPQEADVVVAGGRGLGENGFALAEELAGILRGAVGASRVAVDLGWAPRSAQIGMTGQTVHPRLYIACGISGAVHHTFGMRDSGFVVAINTDAGAPIFQFADVAIVGNAGEVMKALIEALESKRRSAESRTPLLAGSAV